MARQRKVGNIDKQQQKSVKVNSKERLEKHETSSIRTSIKIVASLICISIAAYVGYKGYLETRVNTPYDDNKVSFINGKLPVSPKFTKILFYVIKLFKQFINAFRVACVVIIFCINHPSDSSR